jgi:non-ribosomal peptide synthetase component F/acyl carrier protein
MAHDATACVAALGVVKAGKTLVVLNPRDPAAGLDQIRRDAASELVVVDPRYEEHALAAGFAPEDVITADASDGGGEVPVRARPDDLVSLVYTSGSTGRPKAVMLPHRTVLHHVLCQGDTLGVMADSHVALLAPLSSSWGLGTLWLSLLEGATACLYPIAERGMSPLADWVREEEITEIALAASVFRNVARTVQDRLESVRQVQIGGEASRRADFDAFWGCFPETAVMVSSLGSTECGALARNPLTVDMDPAPGVLPVGRACEGFEILILDEAGCEVPAGEVGEITVRSDYLPPGYWRDPELTAERFAPDPAGPERLFHTRDLGRLSEDGVLSVAGRRDFRVNVRGQLVDLDDVEGALAAVPEIGSAAVHAGTTPRGDTTLTAFLVPREGCEPTAADMRRALGSTLSAAAVPAVFAFLDEMPLNAQGKVDRQALARREPASAEPSRDELPADATERQVAEIWSHAFEVDRLGRHADFFELGGDSLTAAVIAAMVGYTFGVELDLRAVVDSPTVADMAREVERLRATEATSSRPTLTRASGTELPLSFAEESTWNSSRTLEDSARYTFAAGKRIDGQLDVPALRRAVDHIVRRHEILRTSFTDRLGRPVRVVHPAERIDLPLIDVSGAADPHAEAHQVLAEQARVAFDLERTPLLRLRVVRTAPAEHHLIWAVHHIVSDEWSWKVFFDELGALYPAFRDGRPAPVPDEMTLGFSDFAAWQRRWLDPSAQAFRADAAWWGKALQDVAAPPALPFARRGGHEARPSDGVLRWGVPPTVSRELDRLGRAAGATFFMARLAMFAAHLALETRHDDVVVGTYTTGRRQAATQTMIGFFSNLVTLRLRLTPDLSFREVLARARACVIDASAHSDAPYERLSEALTAEGVAMPPIRVIFGVSDQPPLRFAGLQLTALRNHVETMPWEFTLSMDRRDEDRECAAHFDARIHEPAEVRAFLARYRRFAAEVCKHPDRPVGEALAPA